MFAGVERYQLDDRLRVPLPPGDRDALKPWGWVVLSPGSGLEVHTETSLARERKALEDLPPSDLKEDALDEFYASAHKVTPDSQGRITLPSAWAELAGLGVKKPVIVAGRGDFMRLWSEDEWNAGAPRRREARARVGRGQGAKEEA
ncbi:MAG: division/cell wall cluster transcriptional repressor MraZ [Dehalococcoidia bacterium]